MSTRPVEIAPSILSAGHTFIAGTIDNVTRLRAELVRRGLASVEIEVDGGVGPENIRLPDTPLSAPSPAHYHGAPETIRALRREFIAVTHPGNRAMGCASGERSRVVAG